MEANRRPIRSFVLRQGRVSNAQRRAYDTLMPRYGIAYSESIADLDAAFGRRAPRIVEIGSGMGETTAAIARAHPGNDYLAVEVHLPGVGSLLKQVDEQGLSNVRVIRHDAVPVLENMIAPASLAGMHVFFPDPWPKKRHHKRRLIQREFAALLASRLQAGGYLHLATDWEDYALQILEVLGGVPSLENTASGFSPRPPARPPTRFEERGLRLGHRVWDVVFRRRPSAPDGGPAAGPALDSPPPGKAMS